MSVNTAFSLRPLGLGPLLDQAIRLYRRNFLRFIGIIAVVQIPLTLTHIALTLLAARNAEDIFIGAYSTSTLGLLDPISGAGFQLIRLLMQMILVSGIGTAVLTRTIADIRLGDRGTIVGAYKKLGGAWSGLIGALLMVLVITVGLIIWTLVPCIGWLSGPGILIYLLMVITPLLAPVVVLEGERGTGAIRRVWELARRRFWWVIGFVLILFIFERIAVYGPAVLVGGLLNVFLEDAPGFFSQPQMIALIEAITQLLISLLYLPLQLTAITLLYFDLRVRSEGIDLVLQAGVTADNQIELIDLLAESPSPVSEKLITTTEFGFFSLISIAVLLIYAVIWGGLFILLMLASGPYGFLPGSF